MDTSNLLKYATAGRATFHAKTNLDTYHYKVTSKKGEVWFVYARLDHVEDWAYLGHLDEARVFHQGRKCEFNDSSPILKCFKYIWDLAHMEDLDSRIKIWHDGICSVCGRTLKDEKSVEIGIGPECLKSLS